MSWPLGEKQSSVPLVNGFYLSLDEKAPVLNTREATFSATFMTV